MFFVLYEDVRTSNRTYLKTIPIGLKQLQYILQWNLSVKVEAFFNKEDAEMFANYQ